MPLITRPPNRPGDRSLRPSRREQLDGFDPLRVLAGANMPDNQRSDGFDAHPVPFEKVDQLRRLRAPLLLVRWVTTLLCVVQAAGAIASDPQGPITWAVAAVVALTIIRTIWPLKNFGDRRDQFELVIELVILVGLVSATGAWNSPLLFALAGSLGVAGFRQGILGAARYGAVTAATVMAAHLTLESHEVLDPTIVLYWVCILILTAGVAGYAQAISADAVENTSSSDIARLADANSLLSRLHGVALSLPASLDIDDVLDSSIGRIRSLVASDALAILALEPGTDRWVTKRRKALAVDPTFATPDLPSAAREAFTSSTTVLTNDLVESGSFNIGSSSAIYAPLKARGAVIGLLAMERSASEPFTEQDATVVDAYSEPVGLAMDNARWFGRIRMMSAEAERSRIARDLHDRIGQALAYLAFELDGVMRKQTAGDDLEQPLLTLRQDLRGVVSEVRETLYDLRTDIEDDKDLATTTREFTDRLAERASLTFDLNMDTQQRLPILQEREMWRIAQEALTNIERHASATNVRLTWQCNSEKARLVIMDDGTGMPTGQAGRHDSFGLLGMRERAATIGATLDINSQTGQGTTVTCSLNRQN